MMRWLFGRTSPRAAFERDRAELLQKWFASAAANRTPRGLTWVSWLADGETLGAQDRTLSLLLALVPVMVLFEPVAGGDLESVPQAREPRAVVAVFRWIRREWIPDARALFNLTPQQVIERSGGRWIAG